MYNYTPADPFLKLKIPLEENKKNVVLCLSGCFYPIHINHIKTIELAKKHLESVH
jgi:hypothetical protein